MRDSRLLRCSLQFWRPSAHSPTFLRFSLRLICLVSISASALMSSCNMRAQHPLRGYFVIKSETSYRPRAWLSSKNNLEHNFLSANRCNRDLAKSTSYLFARNIRLGDFLARRQSQQIPTLQSSTSSLSIYI